MSRVYIEIEDNVGNQIGGIFTVYDIQDRVSEGTISKATILLCTSDFINNAAIKVSRKFGDGQGKRIDEIVTEDILKGILRTETELSADNIFIASLGMLMFLRGRTLRSRAPIVMR